MFNNAEIRLEQHRNAFCVSWIFIILQGKLTFGEIFSYDMTTD